MHLCRGSKTLRIGAVESVMPDQGFWLSTNGPDTRLCVPTGDADLKIWIHPRLPNGTESQSVAPRPSTVQP